MVRDRPSPPRELREATQEIRRALIRRFPELSPDVPLTYRHLRSRRRRSHDVIFVKTSTSPARHLVAKMVPGDGWVRTQHDLRSPLDRAETEYRVLAEIAPQIGAEKRSLKTRLWRPWWMYCFGVASRQEFRALRDA